MPQEQRAQSDDRPHPRPCHRPPGQGPEHQPRLRLLPTQVGVRPRPRADASHRRVASGISVRGEPDVARLSEPGGRRGRPPPCRHADETHGNRGALPQAEHVEAHAGEQDLSLSAARVEGRAAEPGLGDGHHLYPDGARFRLPDRRRRLVQPAGAQPSRLDHDGSGLLCRSVGRGLAKHGTPGIFNTDQGSQFTSEAFTSVLIASQISISMDGKGAWRDNVFVERIWKSVKYEEVYLHAYDSVGVARASLGRYLDFYNRLRPHSSLDRMTPDEAYFHPSLLAAAA